MEPRLTRTPVTIVPDTKTLLRLADEASTAQRAFVESFNAKYTPGQPVQWVYGSADAMHHGVVVRNGGNIQRPRFLVRNADTDAEYWVNGWRIIAALR